MGRPLSAAVVAALLVLTAVGGVATVAAAPSGFVTVPSHNLADDYPPGQEPHVTAGDLEAHVLASDHAGTLEVVVTTPKRAQKKYLDTGTVLESGELAIVLKDDVNHGGRAVAIYGPILEDALGYKPKIARGTHESGEPWKRQITYSSDGWAIFEVPSFSSNVVTFTSRVELTGSSAADGTSYVYDVEDLDSVANGSLTLTGVKSTETDTESGTISGSGSLSISVAGNAAPEDSGVTITGVESTSSATDTGTGVSEGASNSLSATGNAEPTGPAGGEPELTVTGHEVTALDDEQSGADHASSSTSKIQVATFTDPPKYIDTLEMEVTHLGQNYVSYQVFLNVDGTEYQYDPPTADRDDAASENPTISVDKATNGADVDLYLQKDGGDEWEYRWGELQSGPPTSVSAEFSGGSSVSLGDFTDGQQKTVAADFSGSSSSFTISSPRGGSYDYSLDYTAHTITEDVAIDVDGDGSDEITRSGMLADGATATYSAPEIDLSTTSVDVTTSGGSSVDVEAEYTEVYETEDVDVEINGNTTSVSGAIPEGSTETPTFDLSWIKEGANRVNVSVGGGSVPADSPTPAVGFALSHEATSAVSVEVTEEKWSERYNVSKTFASDREDATLTVPFLENIVEIGPVSYRVNGGLWSDLSGGAVTFNGTTATVSIGSVSASDDVDVKVSGRKVITTGGDVEVLEPTVSGDVLSTRFRIVNPTASFHIDTSGTSDRLVYASEKSWTNDTHTTVTASGGQLVYLPGASDGSTARVAESALDVNPETGGVEVVVQDADEPRFRLRKGGAQGADQVEIVYYDTIPGETYALVDADTDEDVSTDTAESPVSFLTTGETATYLIEIYEGGGGGPGSGTNPPVAVSESNPLNLIVLFGAMAASILGFVYVGRRWFGARGLRSNVALLVGGTITGIVGVEAVTAQSVIGQLVESIGTAIGGFGSSSAGVVVTALAILTAMLVISRRVYELPRWLWIAAGGGLGIWVLDTISAGALSSGLGEISALIWIMVVGGVIVLIYRALAPPEFILSGREK